MDLGVELFSSDSPILLQFLDKLGYICVTYRYSKLPDEIQTRSKEKTEKEEWNLEAYKLFKIQINLYSKLKYSGKEGLKISEIGHIIEVAIEKNQKDISLKQNQIIR